MARTKKTPAPAPSAPRSGGKVLVTAPFSPKRYPPGIACRLLLRPGAAPLEGELPDGGHEQGAPRVTAAVNSAMGAKLHLGGRVIRGRITLTAVAGPSTDTDVFPRFEV